MKLSTNQVYIPKTEARDSHRRIINIFQERVFYSNGGDQTHSCKLNSFIRWIKGHKSELVDEANK